jgi:hypothetical protein
MSSLRSKIREVAVVAGPSPPLLQSKVLGSRAMVFLELTSLSNSWLTAQVVTVTTAASEDGWLVPSNMSSLMVLQTKVLTLTQQLRELVKKESAVPCSKSRATHKFFLQTVMMWLLLLRLDPYRWLCVPTAGNLTQAESLAFAALQSTTVYSSWG